MASIPKDAAAIILLKDQDDPKVLWVKRNPRLTFMGGFHAFPGGQLDKDDLNIPVRNCAEDDSPAMRVCAVREFFEETGVLVANGAERLSPESIREKRQALAEKKKTFSQILEEDDLQVDGSSLEPVGRWVTPPFNPRRFDTWFFLTWLPQGQEALIEAGELEMGEWVRPADALRRWEEGEIIMAPPTLHTIRTLAAHTDRLAELPAALTVVPEARRGMVMRIEFRPGILLFPVQTPTLPPATHTNCYIVGGREIVVIDPASPYEGEQERLAGFLDDLAAEGRKVREIILTHHHPDHVGGVNHLREHLGVPVAAHRLTADRIGRTIQVDRFIEDNEFIQLDGDPGRRWRALHTPGHTRGHLCFYQEATGAVITGDLIVGVGTVVIDPPEGNMRQYFDSLHRLLALPKLSSLFGAHGPAIGSAREKIEEYIEHRLLRENRILGAVQAGATTSMNVVEKAYTDVSPSLYGLAERSALAHLEKLVEEGRVIQNNGHYVPA